MKYLIYFFLICFSTALYPQQQALPNRQYKRLKEQLQYYFTSDIDSAMLYAGKIEKSANLNHKAFAKGAKAYIYSVKGDRDKAQAFYAESMQLLDRIVASRSKDSLKSYLLNYGGLIDWKNKDFSNAIGKFIEGRKVSQAIGDKMQSIKFNNNIAIINAEVGNYASAIKATKQSEEIISQARDSYADSHFMLKKSNIYFNLGKYYEDYYKSGKNDLALLDSALYYFNRTILYSKTAVKNKLNAQMCIGNIYQIRNDFGNAEKMYLNVLSAAKENNLTDDYFRTIYNLGDLYFDKKDYVKSLLCFKRVDSLYYSVKTNPAEFLNSNYYQAKIYNLLDNQPEALKHSEIYFDNYEKLEFRLNSETVKVNSKLSQENMKSELAEIRQDIRFKSILKKILIAAFSILVLGLLALVIVNNRRKKSAERKVADLIEKYKSIENLSPEITEIKKESPKNAMSISEEKEKELLEKLRVIEEKLYYLRPDFTQQAVARKIKTNTSYLSIVVNKYYGKSFGDYFNELRINWVIREMMGNPKYRKYSTQAIAESAGFKSAVSFTKSFNKRTGVTPVQFIKGLEKNNGNQPE